MVVATNQAEPTTIAGEMKIQRRRPQHFLDEGNDPIEEAAKAPPDCQIQSSSD
jgi:hypothetical protein